MHAASVNPEPGSNSLKNCISSHFRELIPFSELFILAFLLNYLFVLCFSKCFNEIFRTFQCSKNFYVVQFSMIKLRSRKALNYYIAIFVICQVYFEKKLVFFAFSHFSLFERIFVDFFVQFAHHFKQFVN